MSVRSLIFTTAIGGALAACSAGADPDPVATAGGSLHVAPATLITSEPVASPTRPPTPTSTVRPTPTVTPTTSPDSAAATWLAHVAQARPQLQRLAGAIVEAGHANDTDGISGLGEELMGWATDEEDWVKAHKAPSCLSAWSGDYNELLLVLEGDGMLLFTASMNIGVDGATTAKQATDQMNRTLKDLDVLMDTVPACG